MWKDLQCFLQWALLVVKVADVRVGILRVVS